MVVGHKCPFPTFISLKSSGGTVRNDILVGFRNKNIQWTFLFRINSIRKKLPVMDHNRQLLSNRVYSFSWNDLLTSSSADALCGRFLEDLHFV